MAAFLGLLVRTLLLSTMVATWLLPAIDHHAIERIPGHTHVFIGDQAAAARAHTAEVTFELSHPDHHHPTAASSSTATAGDRLTVGVAVLAFGDASGTIAKLVGVASPTPNTHVAAPTPDPLRPHNSAVAQLLPHTTSVPAPPPRASSM